MPLQCGDLGNRKHLAPGAFKRAIATAALRTPGGNKTEIGQLVSIADPVFVWGIPSLHSAMVRQGGISKTPDVRFRPIFPRW